jgi:hypothetical protein
MQYFVEKVSIICFIFTILLISCSKPATEVIQPTVQVSLINDPKTEFRIVREEQVEQKNCGGKAETSNIVTRSRTVERTIEWGSSIEVSAGGELKLFGTGVDVGASLTSQLGYANSTAETIERSLEVKAPPSTHMVHTVFQREVWDTGSARIVVGNQEAIVPFSFRHDFDLYLENSIDMGCDNLKIAPTYTLAQTKTPIPQPTYTLYPTYTPFPEPTFTPNMIYRLPVIDNVVLRVENAENGKLLHQDIYFHDMDGDSYIVVYELVSSTRAGIKFENDPITADANQQKNGAKVTGTWHCKTGSYIVILRATILDAAGHASNSKNIDFDCR